MPPHTERPSPRQGPLGTVSPLQGPLGPGSEAVRRVLRGLANGSDPARLLHDVLRTAVQLGHARQGVLVGLLDGVPSPLASTGAVPALLLEVADAAMTSGRLARRSQRDGQLGVAAECLRVGTRVVGALAVGGDPAKLDPRPLGLLADAASLALAHRPATIASATEVLAALARVGGDLDRATVLVRVLDAAAVLFGAESAFCATVDGEHLRVPAFRGIQRDALRDASRHTDFKTFVTGPGLRVDPSSHPVVDLIGGGGRSAVGLPLVADGRRVGHLVLLVTEPPDPAGRALMLAFADHVAQVLRAAALCRRVEDKEEQLASVVHCMANPVVVVDEDGRFLLVNAAAAELFELAAAFVIGEPVAGRLGSAGLESLLTDEVDPAVACAEVALGSPVARVFRPTARRVTSSEGRLLGRVLVLDDITREREAEQVKSDFVAVIGEELAAPLAAMRTRLAEQHAASGDAVLDALVGDVDRLRHLVQDLLFVTDAAGRPPPLHLDEIDVSLFIAQLVDGVSPRVRVRRPRHPVAAVVDQAKVAQVLEQLVDNALRYSQDDVVVEIAERGDDVEVAVVDGGPGLFSGDVDRLFERFTRLPSPRAGAGLGLYISRRLVEALGGRIWCESRLGVGSRFVFSLPRQGPSGDGSGDDSVAEGANPRSR